MNSHRKSVPENRIRLIKYVFPIFLIILLLFVAITIEKRNPGYENLPNLSCEDKEYLISVAYLAIDDFFNHDGENGNHYWPEKFDDIDNRVYVVLRSNGRRLGSWYTRRDNLASTVYHATIENLSNNGIANSRNVQVHIFVMSGYKPLDDGFERGIHGLRFEAGDKGANYYSAYAIEGNYKTERLMVKLCGKAGLSEDCYENPSVDKYYFDTLHFATTRFSDEVVTFYRGNTVDFEPHITAGKLDHSLDLAVNWLLDNLDDDGQFVYAYSPSSGEYSTNNNMIRQLMGSRLLAELSQDDPILRDLHRRNLDYIFSHWYLEEGDQGYIYYGGKSKLGAMAMALRTLVYSPFFEEYSDEAEKLANTILALQNPDGSLEPWSIEPSYAYDKDYLLTFYSGEAILSLVEYYLGTNDTVYLDAAVKSQDYYIDEYVTHLTENYYPAYVPWHTQSLNALFKITGDEEYANAVFVLNDELFKIQNQDGEPYDDMLGRFYDPSHPEYGTPHSSSDAVYTEGLVYAYELAKLVGDREHEEEYKRAIILGVYNLVHLQFRGSNMYYLEHPERVVGAMRYNVQDNRIRIDTTQHVIDAFMKLVKEFEKEDFTN